MDLILCYWLTQKSYIIEALLKRDSGLLATTLNPFVMLLVAFMATQKLVFLMSVRQTFPRRKISLFNICFHLQIEKKYCNFHKI